MMGDIIDIPVNVKCDECGWRREGVVIHDWYKVICPDCEKYIIVNDKDLSAYAGMLGVVAITRGLTPPEKRGKTVKLKVDTAPLRAGGEISITMVDNG